MGYAHPRMSIENPLLTIEGSFSIGVGVGLLIGILLPPSKLGCLALLVVPVAMIFFINWWHGEHGGNLSSTSGLDFVFGPLWPSLGSVVGYAVGMLLRWSFDKRA